MLVLKTTTKKKRKLSRRRQCLWKLLPKLFMDAKFKIRILEKDT